MLFTDGAVSHNGNLASCGGVIRDDSGNFVCVFASKLHSCAIFEAEFWGIFYGLKMILIRGFRNMCLLIFLNATLGGGYSSL
jgi:ribonuclease HI